MLGRPIYAGGGLYRTIVTLHLSRNIARAAIKQTTTWCLVYCYRSSLLKTVSKETLARFKSLLSFFVFVLYQTHRSKSCLTDLFTFAGLRRLSIMLEELRRALHYHVSSLSIKVTKESALDEIRMILRLFSSVYQNDLAEFKCLLKAGVDPNSTDCEGNTLMHIVIENGLYDMAEILVTHGR